MGDVVPQDARVLSLATGRPQIEGVNSQARAGEGGGDARSPAPLSCARGTERANTAYWKIPRGTVIDTSQFGMSTTSLIFRSPRHW